MLDETERVALRSWLLSHRSRCGIESAIRYTAEAKSSALCHAMILRNPGSPSLAPCSLPLAPCSISYPLIASTPPVMSSSSLVMLSWRALLYTSVRSRISSLALSAALRLATIRADRLRRRVAPLPLDVPRQQFGQDGLAGRLVDVVHGQSRRLRRRLHG